MYFSHTQRLIGALAVSGFLNIILLTSIVYSSLKERSPTLYCDQKPLYKGKNQAPQVAEETISQLIVRMKAYSYDQLVSNLKSTERVDNGYTERDIALAVLVAFHHFDLKQALGTSSYLPQERVIAYGRLSNGSSALIKIFPALSNVSFESILNFATTEKWPQTSEGIFLLLQQKKGIVDHSLLDAFLMTPEFLLVESLFRRSEVPVGKDDIVAFLLQGDWSMMADIYAQQKTSVSSPQNILLAYVSKGSQIAANLLLKIESPSAIKKLEDAHVVSLLQVLTDKTPQNQKFVLSILLSPRSDEVRTMAAKRLYNYASEKIPENFEYRMALKRFMAIQEESQIGEKKLKMPPLKAQNYPSTAKPLDTIKKMAAPVMKKITVPSKPDRLYIIQDGDNLWKLSRRFNVEVETLRRYNKLSTDSLSPGSALRIPS